MGLCFFAILARVVLLVQIEVIVSHKTATADDNTTRVLKTLNFRVEVKEKKNTKAVSC